MAEQEREFPKGVWAFITGLNPDTTPESLQQFFAEHYVEMPLERISIRPTSTKQSAVAKISISDELAVNLFDWAMAGDSHLGNVVQVRKYVPTMGKRKR
jgi:hypothetical protein